MNCFSLYFKKFLKIKGFSLLEVIVVLTIISIISAISLPTYNEYVAKTKIINALIVLESYKIKIIEFYLQNGYFPGNLFSNYNDNSFKLKNNNIINSIHYKLENKKPVLFAQLNSPINNKNYVYILGILEGEFINWYCSDNYHNSVDIKYYPQSCTYR